MVAISFRGTANHARFLVSQKATGVISALPVTYEIIGKLDAERLADAIATVVDRHPMLRAEAKLVEGSEALITVSEGRFELARHDLRNVRVGNVLDRLRQIIEIDVNKPDTKFRVTFTQTEANTYFLTAIFHHSLVDGVSIGQFFSEVSRVYTGEAVKPISDTERHPEELIAKFREVETLRRPEDAPYWSGALRSIDTPNPIISSIPEEAVTGHETSCITLHIAEAEHHALRDLARSIGARTFSIYLAIGQKLLQRMCAQDDVIVSIQSAGRRLFKGHEETIGLFSRALIIRTTNTGKESFSQFAREVDQQVTSALAHEMIPYQELIAEAGFAPRFGFNWYPIQQAPRFDLCSAREIVIFPWQSAFDLNFHFVRTDDGLELRLFFKRDRCDADTASVVAKKFLELVRETPKVGLEGALPTSGASLAGSGTFQAHSRRIEEAFAKAVEQYPDELAVVSSEGAVSYSELGVAVDRVAKLIAGAGHDKPRVMLIGPRSTGIIIGALAALKAGGSFALIDDSYPEARIASYVAKLDPHVILQTKGSARRSAWQNRSYSTLPVSGHLIGLKAAYVRRRADAGSPKSPDTAYFLFTSGSTGEPKCIVCGHEPLLNALHWQRETFSIGSGDRVSFLSGVSHDPALRDIFLPLLTGVTLCVPEPDRLLEPGYVRKWLGEANVSVVHLTPAMAQVICAGRKEGMQVAHIREIFLGGERAGQGVLASLRDIAPNARITNVYGATETPQIVLFKDISKASNDPREMRALGHPRSDVRAGVFDRSGRACGYFEPGEITIETPFLSQGYLQQDAETAASFDYPEGSDRPSRYRTGDLGYVHEKYGIILLGRGDDQVKIRGYRVEPGEVTAKLCAIVGHDEAVVLPVSNGAEPQLIAYLAGGFEERDVGQLRQSLRQALPAYMIPERYICIKNLPRLPNGKLDRGTLSAVAAREGPTRHSVAEPANESEHQLLQVWERVLGVSPISVEESLFDLGGDSLTGVMLMVELERHGFDEQMARSILAGATIREIAKESEGDKGRTSKPLSFQYGPLLSRTAVHVARGLLVLLIIAGHWFPGVAERVTLLAPLSDVLTPAFNLSTPGFAIIFGVSFGYFNFQTYKTRVEIFHRQIKLGIALITAGMVLISLNLSAERYIEHGYITARFVISSLYSVLGFYLLALLSLPLWFSYFTRFGFTLRSLFTILFIYVLLDQLTQYLFPFDLAEGPLQLVRNYAAAKFSYFSLSIGAIAGIFVGHKIRERPSLPVERSFLALIPVCAFVGIFWGGALGELNELIAGSRRIDYWKWLIYFGASLAVLSLVWSVLSSNLVGRPGIDWVIKLIASIGILALFFFVFHGLTLGMKGIFVALGFSDHVSIVLGLSAFLCLSVFTVRRVWTLYF